VLRIDRFDARPGRGKIDVYRDDERALSIRW
jgi:hypothetical protein